MLVRAAENYLNKEYSRKRSVRFAYKNIAKIWVTILYCCFIKRSTTLWKELFINAIHPRWGCNYFFVYFGLCALFPMSHDDSNQTHIMQLRNMMNIDPFKIFLRSTKKK